MKSLKKRVDDLEQASGGGNWVYLTVHHTDDGRFRYNGQVYADTDAVRDAADIPPDTMVYFIHWLFDFDPAAKSCLRDENRMEKKVDPKERVDDCPPTAGNPFTRPVAHAPTSEPQFADAPTTVWGPNGLLKHFNYP